jgi:hypothetical protein
MPDDQPHRAAGEAGAVISAMVIPRNGNSAVIREVGSSSSVSAPARAS